MQRNPLSLEEWVAWAGRLQAMTLDLSELVNVLRARERDSTELLGFAAAAVEELDNILTKLRKQPWMENRPQVISPRRKQQPEERALPVKKAV
jgi:hypothetical protein